MTTKTETWDGTNDWRHPELLPFLARHQADADLTRLTEAYRTALEVAGWLQARRATVVAEVAALDEKLAAAIGPARATLQAERLALAGEAMVLPAQIGRARQNHVAAHLAWLTRVHALANGDMAAAILEEEAPFLEARQLADRHVCLEGQRDELQVGLPELIEQRRAAAQRLAPIRERQEAARMVAEIAQARAAGYHADIRHAEEHAAIAARHGTRGIAA